MNSLLVLVAAIAAAPSLLPRLLHARVATLVLVISLAFGWEALHRSPYAIGMEGPKFFDLIFLNGLLVTLLLTALLTRTAVTNRCADLGPATAAKAVRMLLGLSCVLGTLAVLNAHSGAWLTIALTCAAPTAWLAAAVHLSAREAQRVDKEIAPD